MVRELAHGILPAVLTRGGLRAGVDSVSSRMPLPVETDVAVGRLPAAIEAAAYFVVAEALTNVAKHARADRAEVTARLDDGVVQVRVRDDGVGGAHPEGKGFVGLSDRLTALGGELHQGVLRVAAARGGEAAEERKILGVQGGLDRLRDVVGVGGQGVVGHHNPSVGRHTTRA